MSKRLDMFDAMIAKGTRDPFVFYARAMELRSLARLDDALVAFDAVRRDFPSYVPCYLMAGQLAIELGRTEVARDWLETGVSVAQDEGDTKALGEMQGLLNGL